MVPVIRDAGRLTFARVPRRVRRPDRARRARTRSTADDLQGANVSLTNPGGIGTIASVPRLMTGQGTIVATGAIGYPPGLAAVGAMIGAEKVMTMTSTYDHRIIQGAESGQFLQVVEAYLQGEHGFYEQVFADLGAALGAAPAAAGARRRRGRAARRRAPPPAPPAGAAPTRRCCRRCRPRRRCSRRTACTATWPRSSTRSAPSPRATRRSTPRPSASRPS